MSVTISIENNAAYCKENMLQKFVTEDCYCSSPEDGIDPQADCGNCKGSGKYVRVELPFQLDLSNRNFGTLWNALGMEATEYGSIDARRLREAMVTIGTEMLERQGTEGKGRGGSQWMDMGITAEQAQRYLGKLAIVCDAAESREERVYWC